MADRVEEEAELEEGGASSEAVDEEGKAVEQLQAAVMALPVDTEAAEWDEHEVRLRLAPPTTAGLRRRLGDTRGAFAERLQERRRKAKDKSRTKKRKKQLKRRLMEDASTTAVIEMLTKQLSEIQSITL